MKDEKNADEKGFLSALNRFFKMIGSRFVAFGNRFKDGGVGTKVSHFIMGFGNIKHKQIVKGIIFFIVEIGFLAIMIFSPEINSTPFGSKSIPNLFTLGTDEGDIFSPADNSMLMLLFGIVTLGLILVFVMTYLASIKSSYKADLDEREGKKPTSFKQDLSALLDERFHIAMLTPALIGILVFTILPTIFMICIAFTNFDSLHPAGQVLFEWVGFQNFADVFAGTGEIGVRFLPVLGWTILWAFLATLSNYVGGILLALLINRKGVKGKKIWRTIFIITIALPQFISLLAMRNLLADYGPINSFMVHIGMIDEPINFLANAANPWVARFTIVAINIWIGVPFTMLMTTGILMNVPKELYEAAQIDGATKRQAFRHITIPYVVFVTTPYLITSFIGNITNFNVIYLLTGGAPNVPGYIAGETDLLITWLYKLTIDQNDYNLGSVVGILTFIITATATLLTYTRSKSFKEEDAFQ
jgi:arabinogalactan oligomer/maltooligosaccharide transport system permease protein